MLNPNNHTLHEALTEVGSVQTREEKVQLLHKWNSFALQMLLRGAYDDAIQFNLPEGAPPYKQASEATSPAMIQKQVKNNFKYFAKGGAGDRMMPAKREKMFIGMLSIVHPDDAPLLIAMKDKKFQGLYKGVTKLAVQEAWPNLIKDPIKPEKEEEETE